MFYWFKRGASRCGTSREVSSTRFELTIIGADRIEQVEHFETADALHEREVALSRSSWRRAGSVRGWNVCPVCPVVDVRPRCYCGSSGVAIVRVSTWGRQVVRHHAGV
jgi:hypothetical protein